MNKVNEELSLSKHTDENKSENTPQKRQFKRNLKCSNHMQSTCLTQLNYKEYINLEAINYLMKMTENIIRISDKFMFNLQNLQEINDQSANSNKCFYIFDKRNCVVLNDPYFHFRSKINALREHFYKNNLPQDTYEIKLRNLYEAIKKYVEDTVAIFNKKIKTIEFVVDLDTFRFYGVECTLKREVRDYLSSLKLILADFNKENEELENMKQEIILALSGYISKFDHRIDLFLTKKYHKTKNISNIKESECFNTSKNRLDYVTGYYQNAFNKAEMTNQSFDKYQESIGSLENEVFSKWALGISSFFGVTILIFLIAYGVYSLISKKNNEEKDVSFGVNYEETEI